MRPLAAAARCDNPPRFLINERCTFGELLEAVQKECNVDWAELEHELEPMMQMFEDENMLMYREGIVYFI